MERLSRTYDRTDVRLLIGTGILCTFLVLGALAYAIINTNVRVDQNIKVVEDGTTCILGSISGREDIRRPNSEDVERACALFLDEVENNGERETFGANAVDTR